MGGLASTFRWASEMAAFTWRIVVILLISFFLFSTSLLLTTMLQVEGQGSDLASLSYEAFTRLSALYQVGGNSSTLLTQMNTALEQIQEARVKTALGQTAEAQALQDQARSALEKIVTEAPAVQQKAQLEATRRSIVVLSFIPISVVISTVASYLAVRAWRRYDRSRLYEMRIVEENKD